MMEQRDMFACDFEEDSSDCSYNVDEDTSDDSDDDLDEEHNEVSKLADLWRDSCARISEDLQAELSKRVDIDSNDFILTFNQSLDKIDSCSFQIKDPEILESERCLLDETKARNVDEVPLIRAFKKRNTFQKLSGRKKSEINMFLEELLCCIEKRDGEGILAWFASGRSSRLFRNKFDFRLLSKAVEVGSGAIFEYLIGEMFSFDEQLTPFLAALRCNNINIVKKILDMGIDVNIVLKRNRTALHIAASKYSDASNLIKFLIYHGADVNARDCWGNNPLSRAVMEGSYENVLVLAHIVPPPSSEYGKFLIRMALNRDVKVFNLVFTLVSKVITTHLHEVVSKAVKTGRYSIVRYLIQKNVLSSSGTDLITDALALSKSLGKKSDYLMIELLLEAGCKPSLQARKRIESANDRSEIPLQERRRILEHMLSVRSLQHLACLKIRGTVGSSLSTMLNTLHLPKTVRDYLHLKHL